MHAFDTPFCQPNGERISLSSLSLFTECTSMNWVLCDAIKYLLDTSYAAIFLSIYLLNSFFILSHTLHTKWMNEWVYVHTVQAHNLYNVHTTNHLFIVHANHFVCLRSYDVLGWW